MNWNQCYYVVKGKRCLTECESSSKFCPEHSAVFTPLDNPTLIEQAARSMMEIIYVNDEKKISCKVDTEVWGNFTNCLNELTGRGYDAQDAQAAVASMAREMGLFDDMDKALNLDPKWKKFEKIVAGIHVLKAEGAEVKFNDEIKGKRTDRKRQIDISLRFKQSYYDCLAIIECKDYDTKVPIEKVEAFRTKMEDVGAMKGIMVSPKGFQEGAIKTAEAYNIELFTLTEVKSDWTKTFKENILSLPFPTEIQFDYPYYDISNFNAHEIKYREFKLYSDQNNSPVGLDSILTDVIKWLISTRISLPCDVVIPFDPPMLTQFPGTNFYTPIYEIKITFEQSSVTIGKQIDIPPRLEKYIYSDVGKAYVHEILPKDIPPVV